MYDVLHVKNGKVGEGLKIHRVRRITGYLVGDMSRWNHGKSCEEHDRVKHFRA